MTWSLLEKRIINVPLVIAGPILRRVESDSVSVWVACKSASTLKLVVSKDGDSVLCSEPTKTLQLGDHLHVAVVNAKPDGPVQGLVPGTTYLYDIRFTPGDASLGDAGVLSKGLGGIGKVTYGNLGLPSFVMPAATVDGLRLVHGSCRKPHGGEVDAMKALDPLLEATHADPLERPQQLILTGDQIYADEVADVLLFMLKDAGSFLMGFNEDFPGNPSKKDKEVASRKSFVEKHGITSDYCINHLLTLGEFYAMYLFVWSPELWPILLPTWEEVYGAKKKTTTHAGRFEKERKAVRIFLNTLSVVRRALANIPTYMAFDDHEVTDDWFINRDWSKTALEDNVVRRIMQNGLAAFAVFQAWGNTPQIFDAAGPGGHLLKLLGEVGSKGPTAKPWEAVATMVLPTLVPASGNHRLEGHKVDTPTGLAEIRWNFSINYPAHQLIVLDTRSRRAFASKKGAANLISSTDLMQQLPTKPNTIPVTILVSPAPVVGHSFTEETLQPLKRKFLGEESVDYEAWSLNRWAFEHLLEQLVSFGQVVILSGDVHYAFSARMEYWDERSGALARACFVQLCASSLKNSTSGLISTQTAPMLPLKMIDARAGWPEAGEHVLEHKHPGFAKSYVPGKPAVYRIETRLESFVLAPKWRYRISFANDGRTSKERGINLPASSSTGPQQRSAAEQLIRLKLMPSVVLGTDNFGVIKFEWNSKQVVRHELWYAPEGDPESLGTYMVHEIPFSLPETTLPGPK